MSDRFDKWQARIQSCKDTRQSFALQLDWANPDDVELIKIIAFLKDRQDFSKVMRLALKIIPAILYEGRLDELFSEFAWAKLEMLEYMRELKNDDNHVSNGVGDIKSDLLRLEELILQQAAPAPTALQPVGQGEIQSITTIGFAPPSFDDEEDLPSVTLRKASSSGGNATQNFLNSLQALQ